MLAFLLDAIVTGEFDLRPLQGRNKGVKQGSFTIDHDDVLNTLEREIVGHSLSLPPLPLLCHVPALKSSLSTILPAG